MADGLVPLNNVTDSPLSAWNGMIIDGNSTNVSLEEISIHAPGQSSELSLVATDEQVVSLFHCQPTPDDIRIQNILAAVGALLLPNPFWGSLSLRWMPSFPLSLVNFDGRSVADPLADRKSVV